MILMFSTFDVLTECSLHEKAEKEFMTVGWGKKETQFHGSVGKDNRKKIEVEIQDVDKLDQKISCCWRGDGEFFAVNFVGSYGRMFKVFNKEGSMQYVSEICANLQVPIAWKPSGLWIAKPELLPNNKYVITLFERNGLKHNELILPFSHDAEQVTNLCWNQDSDILLIETSKNILYFYTICNYHWYMKYHIKFPTSVAFNWSQNYAEPKQLHIMDNDGNYYTMKFDFVVNHSSGESPNDETVVGVIDGHKLLLTNFKSQMVPPPMCSLECPIENPVNALNFLQSTSSEYDSNCFMTLDHDNIATFYRCLFNDAINGKKFDSIEKIKSFQLKNIENVDHSMWIKSDKLLLTNENTVYLYCVDSQTLLHELTLEDSIGSISKIHENLYTAQLMDGTLIGLDVNEKEIVFSDMEFPKLSEFCERIHPKTNDNDQKVSFYALKVLKKKLYLDTKEIATEVTSFTVNEEFLIYTTIGELKFVKIGKNSDQVIETRRVERGSKIVTLVKDKSQIIFQLPRGNLETISPRILSLKIIKRHLEIPNYKLAFDLLRKERINLNLLIDLQPQKFLDELEKFILQIDNINWLNLFLTELRNENVTETMYKFCDKIDAVKDENYSVENKTSFICGKMLQIFTKLDHKKYLLPSITCHVKNENLESALQIIWDLKKAGGNDKEADDAVKYLLYLIDINVLYNIALGMYDYQLVMFVAQKSQKDPKEYIPFIQDLNSLDQYYAKYKIDCYLKRYTKAIANIAPLSAENEEKFDECIELIKKHHLYEAGLTSFIKYENCYRKICILYGDYLRVKGKFLDAILMYERGEDFKQALSSARNILDWKKCMILARKCNYSKDDFNELASKLMHSLVESNRHKEASELLRKFSNDEKLLIETLVHGRLYDEALLEISLLSTENDFINEIVKPNFIAHINEMIRTIDEDKSSFLQQKIRLLSVRQEKIRKLQNPQEDDDDDMFSDTTSINSQSSRNTAKTFKSSKNKRKHERKLLNLKEGNKFEDVALLDALWRLVHKIISIENQSIVRELIITGVELKMDEHAGRLQVEFNFF